MLDRGIFDYTQRLSFRKHWGQRITVAKNPVAFVCNLLFKYGDQVSLLRVLEEQSFSPEQNWTPQKNENDTRLIM